MSQVVIGLGSNLGDRLGVIQSAVNEIAKIANLVSASPVYETAPVGPPQPDYLNAAILISSRSSPFELMRELLRIELSLGRTRSEKWGPRTIDLDILWVDGYSVECEELTVPHPRLVERAFALKPMLDIVPGAIDPLTGITYVCPTNEGLSPTNYVIALGV